eukprot:12415066-Karenia_brevis.AAC.1
MNLRGRPRTASVNYLSAAWLNKNPGIQGVVRAVNIYQDAVTDKIPPVQAFKSLSWLTSLEPDPAV